MAIYTVHGGHAKTGNKFCGAVGYCAESTEDRLIKDAIIKYLILDGHKAYDCTVDSGISQGNVITQIKKKINSYSGVTANISVHLNAISKSATDGKIKGCETLVYQMGTTDATIGLHICNKLRELGFTNRGVKARTDLGVLKGITNGGSNILVECYFCDDYDDYAKAKAIGVDAIGKSIAEGIVGHTITGSTKTTTLYRIRKTWDDVSSQIGAYSNIEVAKTNCKQGYSVFDNNGNVIYTCTSRPIVDDDVYVYFTNTDLNVQSDIASIQRYLNNNYSTLIRKVNGNVLTVDGMFGAKSKKALACAFQCELKALGAKITVDGDFGNKSQVAFYDYVGELKKGSKGIFVTLWQCLLVGLGYNPKGIDGIAGNGFVSASNQLFKATNLSQDSSVSGVDINALL